jgi:hypothetical protein
MIYVGIDDTDILGSRGTNQLARAIVQELTHDWKCQGIVRHQLLDDPRIPYTSKNGSASITLEPRFPLPTPEADEVPALIEVCRHVMQGWYIEGSDPGLCVTHQVPVAVTEFGWRCKQAVVTQQEARQLAAQHGLHLEGLGGTEGGVIGSLAAVGLIVTGNDGRVVQLGEWPDDLTGPQPVSVIQSRGIVIQEMDSFATVETGTVDVGKHLRPNRRDGGTRLFVRPIAGVGSPCQYHAVKLT